jgi:hypothetical protein
MPCRCLILEQGPYVSSTTNFGEKSQNTLLQLGQRRCLPFIHLIFWQQRERLSKFGAFALNVQIRAPAERRFHEKNKRVRAGVVCKVVGQALAHGLGDNDASVNYELRV